MLASALHGEAPARVRGGLETVRMPGSDRRSGGMSCQWRMRRSCLRGALSRTGGAVFDDADGNSPKVDHISYRSYGASIAEAEMDGVLFVRQEAVGNDLRLLGDNDDDVVV